MNLMPSLYSQDVATLATLVKIQKSGWVVASLFNA